MAGVEGLGGNREGGGRRVARLASALFAVAINCMNGNAFPPEPVCCATVHRSCRGLAFRFARAYRPPHPEGMEPDPDVPPGFPRHSGRLARLAERHRWVRVLLHLAAMIRSRRNLRWHLTCIWRELHEFLNAK